jgi:hypothetical protein
MTIKEAAKILKEHNEWRRGKDVPIEKMHTPTEVGVAIDVAVRELEKSLKKEK